MALTSAVASDAEHPPAIAPRKGSLKSSKTADMVEQLVESIALSENCSSDSTDPSLGHPQRGVSVEHLRSSFLEEVSAAGLGPEAKIYELEPPVIRGKSAAVVCPRDGKPGAAYVDSIRGPEAAGPATHMLSYTWGYAIGDVVGALVRYCEEHGLPLARTYVWICCLCVNQHRVKEAVAAGETVPFEDFRNAFESQVRGIGRVLALMAPWQSPQYITRVWCVFEVFTATQLGTEACEVSIIMPPAESDAFAADLANGGRGVSGIWDACRRLRVQDAEASVEEDKLRILALIEGGVGFASLNSSVRGFLQRWFIEAAVFHVTELFTKGWACTESTVLPACFSVGRFLMHIGRQDKAIELLNQAIEMAEESRTIKTMNGANALRLRGFITCAYTSDPSKGLEMLHEAKRVYEELGKLETVEGAELLQNLSMVKGQRVEGASESEEYSKQAKRILMACGQLTSLVGADVVGSEGYRQLFKGSIASALEHFEDARRIRIATDTLETPDGSKAIWGLAQAHFYRGNMDEAVAFSNQSVQTRAELGVLMSSVGAIILAFQSYVALEQGCVSEAAALCKRAVDALQASPSTFGHMGMDVATAHAYVLLAQGRPEEAVTAIEDKHQVYNYVLASAASNGGAHCLMTPSALRFTAAIIAVHLHRGDLEAAAAAADSAKVLLHLAPAADRAPDGLIPDSCTVLVMVSLVRLGQGAHGAALECLQRARAGYIFFCFQGGPSEALALHVLGRVRAARREWAAAAEALEASKKCRERMRTLESQRGTALLCTLGAVQAARGLLVEAVGLLEEADRIERGFVFETLCAERLSASLRAARFLLSRASQDCDDDDDVAREMREVLETNAAA